MINDLLLYELAH